MTSVPSPSPSLPQPSLARGAEWLSVAGALAFGVFLPVSIAGMQVAWILAALGLAGLLAAGVRPRPGVLAGALALHVATLVASAALSDWGGAPVERWNAWRLLAIPALTVPLARDPRLGRRVLWVALGVAGFVAPYAIFQFFSGVDWLRVGPATVRFPAAFAHDRWRPVGAFNLYSTFAFVYAALALLALARAMAVRDRRRWLALALAAPMVTAVGLTQVRAAWMALGAGVLVMAWLRSRRALLAAGLAVVLAGGLAVATVPAIRNKALSTFDLSYANNGDRVFMWARALEMTADHPLAGIGHGAWTPATRWYFDRWDSRFPVRCHAHDNFLHFWATTGPLGLLGFLWIFTAFTRRVVPAWQRLRSTAPEDAALALGAMGAVAAFAAYALTQDPYFDGEVFYVWVFALALGGAAAHRARSAPRRWPSRVALLGAGLPLVLGWAAGWAEAEAADAGRGPWVAAVAGFAALALGLIRLTSPRARRRLIRDDLVWATALGLAVMVGLYLVVVVLLADPSGIRHFVTAGGVRVGVAALSGVLAARLAWLSPRPRRGAWILGGAGVLAAVLVLGVPAPGMGTSDADGDGVPNQADGCWGWDPTQTDLDQDGVSDLCEPITAAAAHAGQVVVTTASGEVLRLDDGPTGVGHPLGRFEPYLRWTAVAMGPLGPGGSDRLVAASGWARRLELLTPTGARIPDGRLPGPGWRDLAVVTLPSGAPRLVALSVDGATTLYDLSGDRFDVVPGWVGPSDLSLLASDGGRHLFGVRPGAAGDTLLVLDPVQGAILGSHPLPFPMIDLVWEPEGSLLMAASDGALARVDPDTGEVEAHGTLPGGIRTLVPSPRGPLAYRSVDPALVEVGPLLER